MVLQSQTVKEKRHTARQEVPRSDRSFCDGGQGQAFYPFAQLASIATLRILGRPSEILQSFA